MASEKLCQTTAANLYAHRHSWAAYSDLLTAGNTCAVKSAPILQVGTAIEE
jgi:hypothetical protein